MEMRKVLKARRKRSLKIQRMKRQRKKIVKKDSLEEILTKK